MMSLRGQRYVGESMFCETGTCDRYMNIVLEAINFSV